MTDAPKPPPVAPERPPKFSMIRSFTPADFLTIGNAASGTLAIFLCLSYLARDLYKPHLWWAFALLPLALALDVLDGFVARKTRRASHLGADLDSLADVVSFGIAPAVLGFTLGLRDELDIIVLIYFVACGIARLARFNATAEQLSAGTGKVPYYEGTPIPTSLSIVLVLSIALYTGATGENLWGGVLQLGPTAFHPITLLYAISGSLMISTIRIPKP